MTRKMLCSIRLNAPRAVSLAAVWFVANSGFATEPLKPLRLTVLNGGMTQGADLPANWNGRGGEAQATRDTLVFKEGPASLRVSVAGGKSGEAFQVVQGGAGATFRVAGWIKSQGKVKAQAKVQAFAEGYRQNQFIQLKYVEGDADWTAFETEVRLPPWTAFFNVGLLVEGEGAAWLDEVREAGSPVDPGNPDDVLTSGPAPKGNPDTPGWGFWQGNPPGWLGMHRDILARTARGREAHDVGLIFLGDSITRGWSAEGKEIWDRLYAPQGAINAGIGGDSTRQVLWRLQHGEVEGLQPKAVVLKIGTNNLYEDNNAGNDEQIAAGIRSIVEDLRRRLPQTKVLLLGILPRQNVYFSGRILHINALLAKFDNGQMVRFLDLGTKFQATAGKGDLYPDLYQQDRLHLVKKGYETWAAAMEPLLDTMLK